MFEARLQAHVVDGGSVGCIRRGCQVDLDRCYLCPALSHVRTDGETAYLYCRPVFPSDPSVSPLLYHF